MSRSPRINRRIVSTKRHTVGFILAGNRHVTRAEAVRMARQNQIQGVRVVNGSSGPYLMATGKRSLCNIPETHESDSNMQSSTRSRSHS